MKKPSHMQDNLDIKRAIDQALQHHTAGHLPEAESLYRQVLHVDPNQPVALHLLGVIAYQAGQFDVAVDLIRAALDISPDYVSAHNNLGNALRDMGEMEEAAASYRRALAIEPNYAEAHNNLANTFRDLDEPEEAAAGYRKAISIKPDYAEALNNLGNLLQDMGELKEAEANYRKALILKPDLAEARNNLGKALQAQGKPEEAEACYREAVAAKPDLVEAHNNRGLALQDMGKLQEAVAAHCKAISVNPSFAKAHNNLGDALLALGNTQEAVASYRSALDAKPDYAEAHNNLGNALREMGELDAAADSYRQALATKADYAEAHQNLGLLQLLVGNFREGWKNFAWRWKVEGSSLEPRDYESPLWDGGSLKEKTIFIYPEQGLGDFLQLVHLLPTVRARGGRIILEVPAALSGLEDGMNVADVAIAQGDTPPPFDVHVPMFDLPGLLNITEATIPTDVPYITVAPDRVAAWRKRLEGSGMAVGLVWAGNPRHKHDAFRSLPADLLAPLLKVSGIRFFSLQLGERAGEIETLPGVIDLAPDIVPFKENAAAISALDLVITVDTMTAHLAGALARPAWVLLSTISDWRWMMDREDSPWYSTLRLFRQEQRGGWQEVIERVREALKDQS